MKKGKESGNGFDPRPRRKLKRHAKKNSKTKSSKVYKKPNVGQGKK
jgi:hypothetical protein